MFTLAWILCQYNCCFILLLDSSECLGSMVWKPDMNRKKSPIIWKMNLSQKVPGMRVENCQKNVKKNNFQSSLLEVFLKKHCVEDSFQISLPTATLFVFPAQLFSILWIIRTTSSEYRSIMPRAFQTKCEKNDLSPQFNDPSVNETEYDISIHQISCKNKAKPNQCSSNHKVN